MNCKCIFIFLIIGIFNIAFLSSQEISSKTEDKINIQFSNPTSLFSCSENSQQSLNLTTMYGTHRNAVGIEGVLLGYKNMSLLGSVLPGLFNELPESLGFSTRLDALYYEKDFGIPGEKFTGELHLAALYSVGSNNSFFIKYPFINGKRRHNVCFGYTGYVTTDSTSQITGQLDYSYIKNNNAFIINYENDTMLFYSSDKYRTAAFKLTYLHDMGKNVIGISSGFNLWAGERHIDLWEIWNNGKIKIPDEVHRGETVTLYNAKEYAVDVVYVSFVLNNYSLSFGYDSELFKRLIHNNIHYILNDGNIPIIDRPDRFYILFKIGFIDDLF